LPFPVKAALDQAFFGWKMEGVKFSGKKVRMSEFEFKFPRQGKKRKASH